MPSFMFIQKQDEKENEVWKKYYNLSAEEKKLIADDPVNEKLWEDCCEMLPAVEMVSNLFVLVTLFQATNDHACLFSHILRNGGLRKKFEIVEKLLQTSRNRYSKDETFEKCELERVLTDLKQ